jgi:hypothetical protein
MLALAPNMPEVNAKNAKELLCFFFKIFVIPKKLHIYTFLWQVHIEMR